MVWLPSSDSNNPYADRYKALTEQLNLSATADRYALGRALYHLSQRRGFLSNRKEEGGDDGAVKGAIKKLDEDMAAVGCDYLGEFYYKLFLAGKKILSGYPDGSFIPDGYITRAEFTKLIVYMLGYGHFSAPITQFNDVADTHWANANIKTAVVNKKECASQTEFEEKLISTLEENGIELIILAGFMCILRENFTKRYPERIINVHPSLIPSFCGKGFYGLHVHEAALEYGVKVTGATVHFVNEIPDGGRIVLQRAVEIREGDTPEVLQRRIMEQCEWKIMPQAVSLFCQDKLQVDGRVVRILP